jgi:hypothetical protein
MKTRGPPAGISFEFRSVTPTDKNYLKGDTDEKGILGHIGRGFVTGRVLSTCGGADWMSI